MKRYVKYFWAPVLSLLADEIKMFAQTNKLEIIQVEYTIAGALVVFESEHGVTREIEE
jgi:hypothetical protein